MRFSKATSDCPTSWLDCNHVPHGSYSYIVAAATAAAVAVPQPSEIKTFEDWTVACGNGLGIGLQAVSLAPEDGKHNDWEGPLTIVRTAGTRDIIKIRRLIEADEIDRFRIYVDGRLVDTGRVNPENEPIEIVGQDAKKAARAIIRGRKLVNAYWDGDDWTLGSYAKGRGLGDCSSTKRYV